MPRNMAILLLFVFFACTNPKHIQPKRCDQHIVPRLNLSEVFFQEMVPGQEGEESYYLLVAIPDTNEDKVPVLAEVLDDTIGLEDQTDRYIGLCPNISRFKKGEVPEVKIYYMWKDTLAYQKFSATTKEPIYMP